MKAYGESMIGTSKEKLPFWLKQESVCQEMGSAKWGKGQTMPGLRGIGKKFTLYSECYGKQPENFDRGVNTHAFVFSKDHSDCCMQNRLEKGS